MYALAIILDCRSTLVTSAECYSLSWMQDFAKGRPETARQVTLIVWRATCSVATGAILALSIGCASPGPPLPPSLKLPALATGLTAQRVGDQVVLHWTTPSRTTDKLLIKGSVSAEICRQVGVSTPAGKAARCSVVGRVDVTPGASEAEDTLPEALRSGPVSVLEYRVQLLNSMGRTAGPSAAVFAAAGPAPEMVEALQGRDAKAGVVLAWQPAAGTAEAVELERTTLTAPAKAAAPSNNGLPGETKEPTEARFKAGGTQDPGGTVDRTAQIGYTYRYTAQRVETAKAGGQTLELRSTPSSVVTVAVKDEFPPEPPAGLVTVPGFAGEGEKQAPTIDLSWEPDMEPRLAGYRVYRREADGAWARLGDGLVRVAAYRDLNVVAGTRYTYRVTAVSDAGLESGPSLEVTETAAAP
jgi:hypothetical protein